MKKFIENLIDENHKIGFIFDLFIQFLIVLSVILFISDIFFYEYLRDYASVYQNLENLILFVFTFEYILRAFHGKLSIPWKAQHSAGRLSIP